ASSTSSIGPGAVFDSRSESTAIACPEGPVARNFCSPTHFTVPVCMRPPERKDSREVHWRRTMPILIQLKLVFTFNCRPCPVGSMAVGEEKSSDNANFKGKAPSGSNGVRACRAVLVHQGRCGCAAGRRDC